MKNWTEIPSEHLTGNGYTNIHRGWKNTTETLNNEVLVYRTEGTDVEESAEGEFAVQHPLDEDGENTHFFDSIESAENFAKDYMENNPTLD